MKKPSKKTAISALLIGILGTAIWEKILSPLCTFIYIKLSSLIDTFTKTFSNNTYSKISEGYNSASTVDITLSIMLIFLIFSCFFMLFYNLYKSNKNLQKYLETSMTAEKLPQMLKRKHLLNFTYFLLFYIAIVVFMYWFGNITFINHCKTTSLCNLEIISPYVSDLEYKELKSSFYSIQTQEDYEIVSNAIKEIGEKYSLKLKQ